MLIQAPHSKSCSCVTAYGELSSELTTPSGVLKGCPLSRFLFTFVVHVVMDITSGTSDFTGVDLLPGGHLVGLEYADDTVLLGEDADKMQGLVNTLGRNLSMFGMRLEPVKCRMMLRPLVV
ncbi:unnamed protein product [Heterobilharzia americana]|nr:unnamed protein product [Heterobilharzia americana]